MLHAIMQMHISIFHEIMGTRVRWSVCLASAFLIIVLYLKANVTHVERTQPEEYSQRWSITNNCTTDAETMQKFDFRSCRNDIVSLRKRKMSVDLQFTDGHECSHLMTVAGFMGRLGNHMFQAASVIGVAARHNYTPVFANGTKLFDVFELGFMIDFKLDNVENLKDRVCCEYNRRVEVLNHTKNWTLSGYMQSWKYFEGVEDKVRKAFTFQPPFVVKTNAFLAKIGRKSVVNIGVHVRRGDYLSKKNQELGYTVAPASYIQNAMKYFYDKCGKVQFIIVSDDKTWCKDNFNGTTIILSPFDQPALDMALLASCDHVIMTGGTFGWWAGWLSRGITVYYKKFPKKDSWLESQFNKSDGYSDYYPKQWIGME